MSGAREQSKSPYRPILRKPLTWVSLAATLTLGIAIGFLAVDKRDVIIASNETGMVASGSLDRALLRDAAADSDSGEVRIGISYLAKSGQYCRSFALTQGKFAGYACREQDAWRIRMLVPSLAAESGEFRTAASVMPPSVLVAMAQDMLGEALDDDQEAKALAAGWTN